MARCGVAWEVEIGLAIAGWPSRFFAPKILDKNT
jgi:hypothetical protein